MGNLRQDGFEDLGLFAPKVVRNCASAVAKHEGWAKYAGAILDLEMEAADGSQQSVDVDLSSAALSAERAAAP